MHVCFCNDSNSVRLLFVFVCLSQLLRASSTTAAEEKNRVRRRFESSGGDFCLSFHLDFSRRTKARYLYKNQIVVISRLSSKKLYVDLFVFVVNLVA